MQIANVMVDIDGDAGNQVPKLGVTAAEIATLIAIHGESAVHDIQPTGDVPEFEGRKWTNRVELDRLRRLYARAHDGEGNKIVDNLFPGAGARVFETIDELDLPEEFFKATSRATTAPAPAVHPLDHDGDGRKGGARKAAAKKVAVPGPVPEPVPEPAPEAVDEGDGDDGIGDMDDGEKALFG